MGERYQRELIRLSFLRDSSKFSTPLAKFIDFMNVQNNSKRHGSLGGLEWVKVWANCGIISRHDGSQQ
jgi:hypothetical protein